MNISNDWIYYSNGSDAGKLYKIKIDGTQKSKVSNDSISGISILGDFIYYNNYIFNINYHIYPW